MRSARQRKYLPGSGCSTTGPTWPAWSRASWRRLRAPKRAAGASKERWTSHDEYEDDDYDGVIHLSIYLSIYLPIYRSTLYTPYTHAYIHTICLHTCTYACVYIYIYMYVDMHMCIYVYVYIYTHYIDLHVHVHVHAHAHVYVSVHVYVCIFGYTAVCTHTHTHTRTRACRGCARLLGLTGRSLAPAPAARPRRAAAAVLAAGLPARGPQLTALFLWAFIHMIRR